MAPVRPRPMASPAALLKPVEAAICSFSFWKVSSVADMMAVKARPPRSPKRFCSMFSRPSGVRLLKFSRISGRTSFRSFSDPSALRMSTPSVANALAASVSSPWDNSRLPFFKLSKTAPRFVPARLPTMPALASKPNSIVVVSMDCPDCAAVPPT